nr:MAG TPA: hypothetical protein [Caudoviricetes sp.]
MCTLTCIFGYSRYNAESGLINKKTPTSAVRVLMLYVRSFFIVEPPNYCHNF